MATERNGPSIWIFVAGFLALAVVGIAFLVIVGSPSGDTEPATKPYWEDNTPASSRSGHDVGVDPSSSDTAGTKVVGDGDLASPRTTPPSTRKESSAGDGPAGQGGTSAGSPPVTFPGGSKAPEDVTEVLRGDGTLSLSFRVAEDALGEGPQAIVPPIRTKVPPNSSSIVVWIGCARSSRESLAQVSVSETDRQVSVAAVVLVPANSVGCDPSKAPRELTIPLESPVGSRSVMVLPTSTKLPEVKLN